MQSVILQHDLGAFKSYYTIHSNTIKTTWLIQKWSSRHCNLYQVAHGIKHRNTIKQYHTLLSIVVSVNMVTHPEKKNCGVLGEMGKKKGSVSESL